MQQRIDHRFVIGGAAVCLQRRRRIGQTGRKLDGRYMCRTRRQLQFGLVGQRRITQIAEVDGVVPDQRTKVDQDRCRDGSFERERALRPVPIDHAAPIGVVSPGETSFAHHLERTEHGRLGTRAAPPPDRQQQQHQTQGHETTGGEIHAQRRFGFGQFGREYSRTPHGIAPTKHSAIVAHPASSWAVNENIRQGLVGDRPHDQASLTAMDVVWIVLAVAVMACLGWLGFMIEPHWVAKDGTSFLCNAQLLDDKGNAMSRWRETRFSVASDGSLLVDQRRNMRHRTTIWQMVAESPEPPRGRAVFVLRGRDSFDRPAMMALRLPRSSRALTALRPLVGAPADRTS